MPENQANGRTHETPNPNPRQCECGHNFNEHKLKYIPTHNLDCDIPYICKQCECSAYKPKHSNSAHYVSDQIAEGPRTLERLFSYLRHKSDCPMFVNAPDYEKVWDFHSGTCHCNCGLKEACREWATRETRGTPDDLNEELLNCVRMLLPIAHLTCTDEENRGPTLAQCDDGACAYARDVLRRASPQPLCVKCLTPLATGLTDDGKPEGCTQELCQYEIRKAAARVSQPVAPPPPLVACTRCSHANADHNLGDSWCTKCPCWQFSTDPDCLQKFRAAEPVAPGACRDEILEEAAQIAETCLVPNYDTHYHAGAAIIAAKIREAKRAAPAGTQPAQEGK